MGAYGLLPDANLGTFVLRPSPDSNATIQLSGVVQDMLTGKPLRHADVSLIGSSEGEVESQSGGVFEFANVSKCGLTLQAEKDDYYNEEEEICVGNDTSYVATMALVRRIEGYRLRTVLSWEGPHGDLDLRARFFINSAVECKLGPALPRCGGALHKGDSTKSPNAPSAHELIDLEDIGDYQYVFYVEDYAYPSHGPLTRSEAQVTVYSGMLKDSVLELDVPRYDKPDTGLVWSTDTLITEY